MTKVVLRLTTEDQRRAQVLADRLGTKPLTLVFLILSGEMARLEGRLDEAGVEMLRRLQEGLGKGPSSTWEGSKAAVHRPAPELPGKTAD